MATNNAVNLGVTNNPDGYQVLGGTTQRTLTITGSNIIITGSGTNEYTFPVSSCTIASAGKGVTDVTASRALNTTYSNLTTASSMLVMMTGRCATTLAGGTAYMQALSDTATNPTTVISGIIGIQSGLLSEDNSFQVIFPVGTSSYYRVVSSATNGTVTLGRWYELTF